MMAKEGSDRYVATIAKRARRARIFVDYLRNDRGEFHGRLKIDRVKPGSLQGYWPEVNVLVPAGCIDPSGVPDYNAVVEVVGSTRAAEAVPAAQETAAAVESRA